MDREATLIEKICQKMGTPMPVYGGNIDFDAAAYNYETETIYVSHVFFEKLSDIEAEFVLAHEVGHAASRKTLRVVHCGVRVAHAVLAMIALAAPAAVLWAGYSAALLAAPVVLWVAYRKAFRYVWSAYCEELADQFAVKYLGSAALAHRAFTKVITKSGVTPDKYVRHRLKRLQAQALREMPGLATLPHYLKK